MKRNHPDQNVSSSPLQSDSDEEEYEEMSTQKLKKMINEVLQAGPSSTTTAAAVPTSRLRAIMEAVKERILFKGKDEDLLHDPQFKVAMESVERNPISAVFQGVTLRALWDKKRSRFGYHDPTPHDNQPSGRKNYKCQLDSCWIDEASPAWNYCTTHSPTHVYFVRDIKSGVTAFCVITPPQKINGHTDKELNIYSKSKTAKAKSQSLVNYLKTNNNAVLRSFAKLIYSTENILAGEGNHHNMVALSMMIMLYNSVCGDNNRVKLINQEITFRNNDGCQKDFFEKLRRVFEINDFRFKVTGEKKSTTVLPKSLLPTISYPNLPSSYLARDTNTGEMYSGVKWSMVKRTGDGSGGHSRAKKTGLSDFDKSHIKRIYQFAHPQAGVIEENRSYTRLTKEEKIIHDEMKEPAQRIETLGHMASILAHMLGLKVNGHEIIFLCQKFPHFDDSFSKSMFDDVFGYLYGEVLEVEIPTVIPINDGNIIWKFVK
ncbi:hypothetical protein Fcan01_09409 [Folsomia candida]|uniref:Uncharacterized protein n=2 Tax=Folsomia candida TaxID=158441 RepID=A0A226EF53_FOLCA|nr:hypothetical protein Fcan01_09409 [Folsomia candida]